MNNTEVDRKQGEYEETEMVLDKQILMIMKMLAEVLPEGRDDPGEGCDI